MKNPRFAFTAVVLAIALGTTGCADAATEFEQTTSAAFAKDGSVAQGFAEAREKLREENLMLSSDDVAAKAELTPQGDLLIDGKAVAMTAAQRDVAQRYRAELLAVAEAGLDIGEGSAAIAVQAVSQTLAGLFTGNTASIKAGIEEEAKKLKPAALALCVSAKALAVTQEELATALPEFRPYAGTIDVDCDAPSEVASAP